jgi:hypothetical protein
MMSKRSHMRKIIKRSSAAAAAEEEARRDFYAFIIS